LNFEMTYRVKTTNPLPPTERSPFGAKQYWQVSEASLAGKRVTAELAATGSDWILIHDDDDYWRPDVHAQFVTDDGVVILLHYTGLVEQTDVFKRAADTSGPTEWSDQYMRLSMRFETGSARYAWLNKCLFVAWGRLEGAGWIEYAVFRVI
jgi:hypothetical protein